MDRPRFTIITPALNARSFLPRNLAARRAQGLPSTEVEHWVIDGGSQDGTAEFLRDQPDVKFLSEPDRGLSHAVNKGLERAHGDWILWVNADDELAPGALASLVAAMQAQPEARMFCGRQKVFGYDGTLETTTGPSAYDLADLLGTRTAVVQASTVVQRTVYEAVGRLDESFRYAMDYEWIVRARQQFACAPIPAVLTHYHRRPGSIMDAGIAGQHREFLRVRRLRGLSRWAWAEWVFRFYLATDPLRQLPWLRRLVRLGKALGGNQPAHPIPPTP